jgi:hypothetical protein
MVIEKVSTPTCPHPHTLRIFGIPAGIAQLVEHDLAKVGVASSSLVSRSRRPGSDHRAGLFSLRGVENQGECSSTFRKPHILAIHFHQVDASATLTKQVI